MRHITFAQLRELADFDNIDPDLLAEGFRIAGSGRNHIWTTMENLEKDATAHAIERGWDPENMLALYDPPKTEEERKELEAQAKAEAEEFAKKVEAGEESWDNFDIQIGYVDPQQLTASLYPNMTAEKLINIIMGPSKFKAFL